MKCIASFVLTTLAAILFAHPSFLMIAAKSSIERMNNKKLQGGGSLSAGVSIFRRASVSTCNAALALLVDTEDCLCTEEDTYFDIDCEICTGCGNSIQYSGEVCFEDSFGYLVPKAETEPILLKAKSDHSLPDGSSISFYISQDIDKDYLWTSFTVNDVACGLSSTICDDEFDVLFYTYTVDCTTASPLFDTTFVYSECDEEVQATGTPFDLLLLQDGNTNCISAAEKDANTECKCGLDVCRWWQILCLLRNLCFRKC